MPKKDLETPRISRIGSFIVPPGAQCVSHPRLFRCQRGLTIKQKAEAQGNTEPTISMKCTYGTHDASGAADTDRAMWEAARRRHRQAPARARKSRRAAAACRRLRSPRP